MKLSIRESASADLSGIHGWIAKDSPASAASVIRRIMTAIDNTILPYPLMGRAGRAPGTREWVVQGLPYIIVYETDFSRGIVTILSIKHTAQRR